MKNEFRIYFGIGVFFVAILLLYFLWSGDGGNSIMLLATSLLGLLPGAYLGWWSRRMSPRPEDLNVVTRDQISGSVGAFPTHTIWPFVLGMGAFFLGLSFVFGSWLAVVGLSFAFAAAFWGTLGSRRGGVL